MLSTVIIRWDVSMKTFIFPLSKQVVISVRECLRAQNSFLWNLIRSLENVLAACKHMLCLQDNYNCVVTLWKYLDVLEHTSVVFRMRYTFRHTLPHPLRQRPFVHLHVFSKRNNAMLNMFLLFVLKEEHLWRNAYKTNRLVFYKHLSVLSYR